MAMIPFGRRQDKNKLQVENNKNAKIFYHRHPLELDFAPTYWTFQGLSLDKVIL